MFSSWLQLGKFSVHDCGSKYCNLNDLTWTKVKKRKRKLSQGGASGWSFQIIQIDLELAMQVWWMIKHGTQISPWLHNSTRTCKIRHLSDNTAMWQKLNTLSYNIRNKYSLSSNGTSPSLVSLNTFEHWPSLIITHLSLGYVSNSQGGNLGCLVTPGRTSGLSSTQGIG